MTFQFNKELNCPECCRWKQGFCISPVRALHLFFLFLSTYKLPETLPSARDASWRSVWSSVGWGCPWSLCAP